MYLKSFALELRGDPIRFQSPSGYVGRLVFMTRLLPPALAAMSQFLFTGDRDG